MVANSPITASCFFDVPLLKAPLQSVHRHEGVTAFSSHKSLLIIIITIINLGSMILLIGFINRMAQIESYINEKRKSFIILEGK